MKVKEFIGLLDNNRGKEMKVAYLENQYVDTNYHLTEVKNVTFETTDCGGKTNDWTETHMQLWESPEEKGKSNYMTTDNVWTVSGLFLAKPSLSLNMEINSLTLGSCP